MENCVAPGLDEFDVLLEVVLSLVRVYPLLHRNKVTVKVKVPVVLMAVGAMGC